MYATVKDYLYKNEPLQQQRVEIQTAPIINPPPENPVVQAIGYQNTVDPKIWGPHFWFSLHVSATHYPIEASPIVCERMVSRILSIPYEIPCSLCRPHAIAFIEARRDALPEIVKGRHSLGQFYVDFHNQVNKRYNKPEWTYEQAYKFYGGN